MFYASGRGSLISFGTISNFNKEKADRKIKGLGNRLFFYSENV